MEQLQTALSSVGIYAALNFFILVWIANATGVLRRQHGISVGSGGNKHLERTMRGHANAVENIPVFLVGLVIAALLNMPVIAIHALGATFTVGRVIHAHHFISERAPFRTRVIGYGLALTAMIFLFVGLLGHAIWLNI